MNHSLACLAVVAATLFFGGCAAITKQQLAEVRAANLPPTLTSKFEHGGALTPGDLIELRRRRVDDGIVIRQLDRAGMDYILTKDDVKRMKAAGVSRPVTEAAIAASNRFVRQLYTRYSSFGYGWYPYSGVWGWPGGPFPSAGFIPHPGGPGFGGAFGPGVGVGYWGGPRFGPGPGFGPGPRFGPGPGFGHGPGFRGGPGFGPGCPPGR